MYSAAVKLFLQDAGLVVCVVL